SEACEPPAREESALGVHSLMSCGKMTHVLSVNLAFLQGSPSTMNAIQHSRLILEVLGTPDTARHDRLRGLRHVPAAVARITMCRVRAAELAAIRPTGDDGELALALSLSWPRSRLAPGGPRSSSRVP